MDSIGVRWFLFLFARQLTARSNIYTPIVTNRFRMCKSCVTFDMTEPSLRACSRCGSTATARPYGFDLASGQTSPCRCALEFVLLNPIRGI